MATVGEHRSAEYITAKDLFTYSQDIAWVAEMTGADLSDAGSVLIVGDNEDWLDEVWVSESIAPRYDHVFRCVYVHAKEANP